MTAAKKKPVNGRNKGASFERQIAAVLRDLTGVNFARNLEQYRTKDGSDLIPDDAAWPFALELKAYASGKTCRPAWKEQAVKAANAVGRIPAVVYKFNNVPVRCAVPMAAMCAAFGGEDASGEWVEVTVEGLAYLAGEIMAGRRHDLRNRNQRSAATNPAQVGHG